MDKTFVVKPIPRICFGWGTLKELPNLLGAWGQNVLILTGGSALEKTAHWQRLQQSLQSAGIFFSLAKISGEPSPETVDSIVCNHYRKKIDAVVAIGGGSVLDAGKAVSAMLPGGQSVLHFLEDVGDQVPDGRKVPFLAVPTTSGTGSEATSNAVLSRIGMGGFKKSLRHDNYVPDIALVDPELTLSCPRSLTVHCAMDAFTQLVESYLSVKASPFTDDLAHGALRRMRQSMMPVCRGTTEPDDHSNLSYAALISGITLANAGLGVVHGFASVLGGLFNIPHGVVCGTLMATANEVTLRILRRQATNLEALTKYSRLGRIFSDRRDAGPEYYQDAFIDMLSGITADLEIKMLSDYGISRQDISAIVEQGSCKNNPVRLGAAELAEILERRIA